MLEAQAAADPGLLSMGQRVGGLLSAATAGAATASLLLLGLPTAAPLPAAPALPAASWADRGHCGLLPFLIRKRNGGHRRHHIVGLLAVVGGEEVGPGAQRLLVRHLRLREKDAELPGQLVEKQAVEEGIVLLAPGTETQQLRQQLRRLLGPQRWKVEQLFYPLDVGQLMRSQQAAAQLRVGVLRKRVRFNQVGDEAPRRRRQGWRQLKNRLLSSAMLRS